MLACRGAAAARRCQRCMHMLAAVPQRVLWVWLLPCVCVRWRPWPRPVHPPCELCLGTVLMRIETVHEVEREDTSRSLVIWAVSVLMRIERLFMSIMRVRSVRTPAEQIARYLGPAVSVLADELRPALLRFVVDDELRPPPCV